MVLPVFVKSIPKQGRIGLTYSREQLSPIPPSPIRIARQVLDIKVGSFENGPVGFRLKGWVKNEAHL